MDFADGKKEAELLREILHLIEESIFRREGEPVGFMADLIMKEMEKKGFNDKDFSFITVTPAYLKDYENALTEEKIPFLVTTDIYGNRIITIQSQNNARLLDIDATIKKGSSEYTRADYIGSFLATSKKLGRDVFSIELNAETANILAAKTFQHTSGFVSSFHNGKVYFDETAANAKFADLFLDTGVSTIAGTRLGRIKRANNLSESIMVDKVSHAVEAKTTRYFANAFANKEQYLKVENGIVEVHWFKDKLDVVKRTYDRSQFKDEESFHHAIATELGKINNCRDLTEEEYLSYKTKTRADLQEDREDYLIKQVEYIAAFENEDHPKIRDDDEYMVTDLKTLYETKDLLETRILEEKDPQKQLHLYKIQNELNEFIEEKKSYSRLLKFAKSELETEQHRNPNYKYWTSEQKLQWQLKTMEHILMYSDHKSVTDFMENVEKNNKELTREELVNSFKQYSNTFEKVSLSAQEAMAQNLTQSQATTSTPPAPSTI